MRRLTDNRVQKHGTTSAESEANISAQLQAKIEESYTKQELDKADEATAVMKASLEKADKAFQKANDDVPSGNLPLFGTLNIIANFFKLGKPVPWVQSTQLCKPVHPSLPKHSQH